MEGGRGGEVKGDRKRDEGEGVFFFFWLLSALKPP